MPPTRPADRVNTAFDAASAAARARRAQQVWASWSIRSRLEVIRRFRHRLAERAEWVAAQVDHGQRASPFETVTAEVAPLLAACRFLEQRGRAVLRPRKIRRPGTPVWLWGTSVSVRREPHGVVLVIGPANYPLFLPGVQILQALTAGNAVLLKPGRDGGPAAATLRGMLAASGLPRGVLQVFDDTRSAGRAALEAGVDKVVLTGSASTGTAVLKALAPQHIPATLELGGCDAVFVRPEADVAQVAASLSFGLTLNAGATCIAPHRVFVHHALAGPLEAALAEALRDAPAVPLTPGVESRIIPMIDEATLRGARVVIGGRPEGGRMQPLVLADAEAGMALLRSDTFAPWLALVPVQDDDEALTQSARCPLALGAVVFGEPRSAHRMAAQIRAGVVVVNDLIVPTADPRVPFGGTGGSGFGTTRGSEGLLAMTRPKALVVRRGSLRPHLRPPPPSAVAHAAGFLQAAYGGGVGARVAGLVRMIRGDRAPADEVSRQRVVDRESESEPLSISHQKERR